jgi:hypothetical protein
MPPEHNQQHQRRPHYHRGRRGTDRRGGDRRPQPAPQPDTAGRDQLDVEQIMREIRSRISERHGIDLSSQQIQELAARRLEAILDPRAIKPSLMDELRRAAGLPADVAPSEPEAGDAIEESALYESGNGFVRAIRRLLNPLLKLFFNPSAVVEALNAHTRRAHAAAARETEQRRRQTEWNALHFEILRRLVTDTARAEIDNQHLSHRVESLSARVDFSERRLRGLEQTQHLSRPSGRVSEPSVVSPAAATAREEPASQDAVAQDASADGGRRRRRRRRGRRSGQPRDLGTIPTGGLAGAAVGNQSADIDEFAEEDGAPEDLIEEPVAAALTEAAPPVTEFEQPSPRSEEAAAVQVGSSALEPVSSAPDDAAGSPTMESTERPDPIPPGHSGSTRTP